MTILTFPTLSRTPSGASHRLRGNTQTHRSPLDATTQTLEMPGSVWEFSVRWQNLPESDWRILSAFLSELRGRAGRFAFSPAIFAPRRGTGGGVPLLGSNTPGSSLWIDGWDALAENVMLVGDWLSYQDSTGRTRLHMVTQSVNADEFGQALTFITPPVRGPGNIGDPVEVLAPTGVFLLPDDAAPEIEIRPPRLGSVTLTMVEALVAPAAPGDDGGGPPPPPD